MVMEMGPLPKPPKRWHLEVNGECIGDFSYFIDALTAAQEAYYGTLTLHDIHIHRLNTGIA